MNRLPLLLGWLGSALLLGCGDPAGPGELYPGYFLASVDGQLLPAPTSDLPQGFVQVAGSLGFEADNRPREGETGTGLVTYSQIIRDPDQVEHLSTVDLLYSVSGGELRINLCPPLALCIVSTELVGPVDRVELVLTHFLAGQPRSVYRFHAMLPD